MTSLVQYLLIEHMTPSGVKGIPKHLDPRSLLIGTSQDEDETFCLRLALANTNLPLLELFWSHFDYLYDERHLMTVARYLMFLGPARTGPLIEPFLMSKTTQRLFLNSPFMLREEFVELFSGQAQAEVMPSGVMPILQEHYMHPVDPSETTLL
jgi:hypothetical protein